MGGSIDKVIGGSLDKIGDIEGDAIVDGSITTIKIDDGAVTTIKLDDNSVTDAKIATHISTKITGLPTQTQRLHALLTTEQLRLSYDASNYASFAVASDGTLTIDVTNTDGGINLIADKAIDFTSGIEGFDFNYPTGSTNNQAFRFVQNSEVLFNVSTIGIKPFSIGTSALNVAKLEVLSTSEQMRLLYDATNYASFIVSSNGDLTITPTGDDLTISDNLIVSGNLVVDGTTVTKNAETVNLADNHIYMNSGYTTTVAESGGLVVNYLPTSTGDTVSAGIVTTATILVSVSGYINGETVNLIGTGTGATATITVIEDVITALTVVLGGTGYVDGETVTLTGVTSGITTATATITAPGAFVAGVSSTSNPTVETFGAATFATSDFIQISGSNNNENDGIYEVLSHTANVLTIRGIGITSTVQDFSDNQFTANASDSATITKINVSIFHSGTDGLWETAKGSATTLVFDDMVTEVATQTLLNKTITASGNTLTIASTDLTDTADIVLTTKINTYDDFDQVFHDDSIKIRNPAETFQYTIQGASISADRIATIPPITSNDEFVFMNHIQTITNKTNHTVDGTELLPSYAFINDTATGMRLSATNILNFSARGFDVLQLTAPVTATSFVSISAVDDFTLEDDPVVITVDGSVTNTTLSISSKGSGALTLNNLDGGTVSIGSQTAGVIRVNSTGVTTIGSIGADAILEDGRVLTLQSFSGSVTKTRISILETELNSELSIGIGQASQDSGAAFFETLTTEELRFGNSAGTAISVSGLAVTIPGTLITTGDFTANEAILQNPASPEIVASVTDSVNMDAVQSVVVVGNIAFVVSFTSDSIASYDVTDKTATPTLIGSLLDTTNLDGARYLDVVDGLAYVVCEGNTSLTIIDVSDPANLTFVNKITDATNLAAPQKIIVVGKYAFTLSRATSSIFSIYNISNTDNITLTGSITSGTLANSESLEVVGDLAYIANPSSMAVIDHSDKTAPSVVGSRTSTLIGAQGVTGSGQYAYCIDFFDDSFVVLDVSTPTNPIVVGSITDATNLNQASNLVVSGKYVYVQGRSAIAVIDVSTPTVPFISSVLLTSSVPSDLHISGKYLYTTFSGTDTLSLVDITGIDSPSAKIGSANIGYLTVSENATVVGDLRTSGLNVGVGGIHSIGDMSTAVGKVSVSPTDIVEISTQAEYDALFTSGVLTVTGDLSLDFKIEVTGTNVFIVDGGNLALVGNNRVGVGISYSGTGTLITCQNGGSVIVSLDADLTSTSTGTLFNVTGGGNCFVETVGLTGWDSLGSITGGIVTFNGANLISVTDGITITDPSVLVVRDFGQFGTALTGSAFTYSNKNLNTLAIFDGMLFTNLSGCIFDFSTILAQSTPVYIDVTQHSAGDFFKLSTVSDATFTAIADGSLTAGAITAQATNSDGQTTHSSTTTYFEGELVTITGTTSYNGTFQIFNVVAGVSFDTITTFVSNDATGTTNSDRLTVTLVAGHGIVTLDDLKIKDTNFYNGFVPAIDVTGDVLTINGTFIATDTGSIEINLSLDQTDTRIRGDKNFEVSDSRVIAFGFSNANTTSTTVTDGTYAAVDATGFTINQDATERFKLTSATNAIFELTATEDFKGILSGSLSAVKTGSTENYRFAMSTNGVAPTFATANYVPMEVKTTKVNIALEFSVVLTKGDTIQVMVAGDGTANSLTITDLVAGIQ